MTRGNASGAAGLPPEGGAPLEDRLAICASPTGLAFLGLLLSSLLYTPSAQLLARARLMVRRRLRARFCLGRPQVAGGVPEVRWNASAPSALFSSRGRAQLVQGSDTASWRLVLPYQDQLLVLPTSWHPPALEVGTRMDKLALHSMEYLRDLPPHLGLQLMEDWMAANREVRPGYWLDAWNSWALSIRVVTWMQWMQANPSLPSEASWQRLLASLARQLAFLCENLEEDIRGNHIIKDIRALLWAAAALEGPQVRAWETLALRLLRRELAVQVLADGVHFERSPAYHCVVVADLMDMAWVSPAAGQLLEEPLRRMGQALGSLTHPDGGVALLNDGTLDMSWPPAVLRTLLQERLGISCTWADGPFALTAAGFYGLRSGDTYLIMDAGSLGPPELPAHAHAQPLSLEVSVRGRRRLVHGGLQTYDAGPQRAYDRSAANHNCVLVDGLVAAECWSSFRVGRRYRAHVLELLAGGSDARWRLRAVHDGFRRHGLEVAREVSWDAERACLEVQDALQGRAAAAWVARGCVRSTFAWQGGIPPQLEVHPTPQALHHVPTALHSAFSTTLPGLRTFVQWSGPRCSVRATWLEPDRL